MYVRKENNALLNLPHIKLTSVDYDIPFFITLIHSGTRLTAESCISLQKYSLIKPVE